MGNLLGCLKAGSEQRLVAPVVKDDVEVALLAAGGELNRALLRSFEKDYTLGKLIGHGAFAKVYACTHVHSGRECAVKVLQKAADKGRQRESLVKEIAIMRLLEQHPNVAKLYSVYEDAVSYHLVMELCTGGELFDKVIQRGHFSEQEAASLIQRLLDFVAYAHANHVIHRDLKPENILLSDMSDNAQLKVIDYGTSDICRPGQILTCKFGTPYYVAPEVLLKRYSLSADIWSCGVILYILLCGHPPFSGKSDSRILQKVALGSFDFIGAEWAGVSEAAKHLISRMLVMEPEQRPTAEELLQHPWFATAGQPSQAPSQLSEHMVKRLRAFAGMSRMKRLALVVLARSLTDRDVTRLRNLFGGMDADGDGRITPEQLQSALEQVNASIPEDDVQALFAASDPEGLGQLDYEEFIAAMLDSSKVAKRQHVVRKSFEQLDKDGDGFITVYDIAHVLQESSYPSLQGPAGRKKSLDMAAQMLSEVSSECVSRLSFEQYTAMWQAEGEDKVERRLSRGFSGSGSGSGTAGRNGSGSGSRCGSGNLKQQHQRFVVASKQMQLPPLPRPPSTPPPVVCL